MLYFFFSIFAAGIKLKNTLELFICLKKEINFNSKMLSKADKSRVKQYPNLLKSNSFKNWHSNLNMAQRNLIQIQGALSYDEFDEK